MLRISDYLNKFRNLASKEGEVKKIVIDVVSSQCGVALAEESINFHNRKVFVSSHPLIKNEINLKKRNILARVNEKSKWLVDDIR